MSTLLLIPWIIYGYKHPESRFIGLCQTKKGILLLLSIEIVYWIVLVLLLGKFEIGSPDEGKFSWRYILFYEKGIIPLSVVVEQVNPALADKVDADYKFLYLVAALIMDYIFLFIISPRVPQLFKKRKVEIKGDT